MTIFLVCYVLVDDDDSVDMMIYNNKYVDDDYL